jgi:arginine decarboxylase
MLLEQAPAARASLAGRALEVHERAPITAASAEAPYLEALRAYAAGDPVRLTVPGHKGGAAAPAALARALEDALALDVPTLIEGVDLGPAPTPLARAYDLAAQAWGAARTWFLPHGATQGNLTACLALRAARGRQVVVQRNVHASVVSGLIAAGLQPHWLAPELDPIAGVAHGVTASALDEALASAPGARAVIVVAPTFHGAMPDVAALAAVAHCHGAALVVDEAWGAHLPFHPSLPLHAIAAGADLVVSSTHKSLGSLSGSAMLHQGPLAERWLPAGAIDQALGLLNSTSPSALALASLDAARARAVAHGERLLDATLRSAAAARAQLTGLPGVRVLGPELAGAPGVHAFDPLRLTVDLLDTGRDARAVARALRERHGIELELATDRLLVAVLGMGDGELGLAEHFAAALIETLWTVPPAADGRLRSLPPVQPGPAACSPRAAWMAPQERVPAEAAIGRIATETLSPYPPGIPAVLPGERLEGDVVATLRAVVTGGGVVRGSADGLATFGVVAAAPAGKRHRAQHRARGPRRTASGWAR